MAYDALDPIGGQRIDLLFAMLCQVVANSSGNLKSPADVKNFIPKWEDSYLTDEEELSRMKAAARNIALVSQSHFGTAR
jgi:hypothetical protein